MSGSVRSMLYMYIDIQTFEWELYGLFSVKHHYILSFVKVRSGFCIKFVDMQIFN